MRPMIAKNVGPAIKLASDNNQHTKWNNAYKYSALQFFREGFSGVLNWLGIRILGYFKILTKKVML